MHGLFELSLQLLNFRYDIRQGTNDLYVSNSDLQEGATPIPNSRFLVEMLH